MICAECGNQIVHGCGPLCLVCQHTGRGRTAELQAHALAAALGVTYAALLRVSASDDEIEAALTVKEAQKSLSRRIQDQQHSRERPDLKAEAEEEREREPVCQSCNGTGMWMHRHCPDCWEPDERE